MTLRDLFQTMVELKQARERDAAKNKANVKTSEDEIKEENKKVGNHQLKLYSTLTYLPTKLLLLSADLMGAFCVRVLEPDG